MSRSLQTMPESARGARHRYSEYTVKWVTLPWEAEQAYQLRRRVFCDEQGLFDGDDLDVIDAGAQLLVALGGYGGWHEQVVGTVRIHEERSADQPGVWWGSRLAVDPAFRAQGQLGSTLIRLAVSSAHALGCQQFFAHVQKQNEGLFQRLHWQTLQPLLIRGREHMFMQADLSCYPPCSEPVSGFVLRGRQPVTPTQLAPLLSGELSANEAMVNKVMTGSVL